MPLKISTGSKSQYEIQDSPTLLPFSHISTYFKWRNPNSWSIKLLKNGESHIDASHSRQPLACFSDGKDGKVSSFAPLGTSWNPRFLASGSGALRGDGGSVYVDTVQCTGSGTLPTEPVLWRMGMGIGMGETMEISGKSMDSMDFYGLLLDCCWILMFFGTFSKCAEKALKIFDKNTRCEKCMAGFARKRSSS